MRVAGTRRLTQDQRRRQLIDIGVALVAKSSFDAVPIDRVAEQAGISRSLLFHYFPTKRDFQVAVAQAGADELLAATEPDPELPAAERLRDSLDAFVRYVADRGEAFVSLVRGASGGDPALQEVFERAHTVVASRVLDGLGLAPGRETVLLRISVRGWVAFLEEATVVWIAEGGTDREALVDLLQTTLVTVVAAADPDGELRIDELFGEPS